MSAPAAPAVGISCKVWLPGETFWAKSMAIEPDGSWHGKIVNHVSGPLHDYKFGQVVHWVWLGDRWGPNDAPGGNA